MNYLTEIKKLADGLMEKGIPFTFKTYLGGYQIVCTDWDAVCHTASYGKEDGLLEIYGSIVKVTNDTVEGWLTAEEVLSRL